MVLYFRKLEKSVEIVKIQYRVKMFLKFKFKNYASLFFRVIFSSKFNFSDCTARFKFIKSVRHNSCSNICHVDVVSE